MAKRTRTDLRGVGLEKNSGWAFNPALSDTYTVQVPRDTSMSVGSCVGFSIVFNSTVEQQNMHPHPPTRLLNLCYELFRIYKVYYQDIETQFTGSRFLDYLFQPYRPSYKLLLPAVLLSYLVSYNCKLFCIRFVSNLAHIHRNEIHNFVETKVSSR